MFFSPLKTNTKTRQTSIDRAFSIFSCPPSCEIGKKKKDESHDEGQKLCCVTRLLAALVETGPLVSLSFFEMREQVDSGSL